MKRLEGRVALITGAASGIGRATAGRLAEEGAVVVVTDVQVALGEEAVAELRERGGAAHFLHLDVTSEQGWADVVDRVLADHGRLDILVNNAGLGDLAPIEETTLADYERTISIDQTGVFLGMKACAEALKASGRGSVVNISSIFGTSGGFGTSPAYHAAKGAVRTLTKNVALHWATEGVRVNSIHPGFIRTPILDQAKGTEIWDAMTASTPMGRLGEPDEIAAAVAYLASDDASFVTGAELYVDGGYIAR
jgi:NAD(P)-dependent dehydrogenase (short-subunit alcohol dehydrogenase family)